MNNPTKLNGWTGPMLDSLFHNLQACAADPATAAVILTGADPYYCAGANLSENIKPMLPRTLHQLIRSVSSLQDLLVKSRCRKNNELLFTQFLDFPKPLLAAVNGPAIGGGYSGPGRLNLADFVFVSLCNHRSCDGLL